MKTIEITKINNVSIIIGNDAERQVPVKPICDALGIDVDSQRKRIERDEILSSTTVIMTAVAADGKEREMLCLPLKYVFGWLFSIDTSRVNEDSRPLVIKYKMECYNALYEYFSSYAKFVKQKQELQAREWEYYCDIQREFHEAKDKLTAAKKRMSQTVNFSYEEWKMNNRQLALDFKNI
jgi:hypothetical protein